MGTDRFQPKPDDAEAQPPSPAGASSQASARRGRTAGRLLLYAALWLFVFVLLGAALVAFVSHMQVDQATMERWQGVSGAIRRWGMLVQGLIVGAVGIWWRPIVEWARRKDIVKEHEFERVLGLRGPVFLFGLAYLLLVPVGPLGLWHSLFP